MCIYFCRVTRWDLPPHQTSWFAMPSPSCPSHPRFLSCLRGGQSAPNLQKGGVSHAWRQTGCNVQCYPWWRRYNSPSPWMCRIFCCWWCLTIARWSPSPCQYLVASGWAADILVLGPRPTQSLLAVPTSMTTYVQALVPGVGSLSPRWIRVGRSMATAVIDLLWELCILVVHISVSSLVLWWIESGCCFVSMVILLFPTQM